MGVEQDPTAMTTGGIEAEAGLEPVESRAVLAVGQLGTGRVSELALPAIPTPGGYLGISVETLRNALEGLPGDAVMWVRADASERQEVRHLLGGRLVINEAAREISVDGSAVHFPTKEYEILKLLGNNIDRVVERSNLESAVWGPDSAGFVSQTLNVHIKRVRSKLGVELQEHLLTVRAIGHKLVETLPEK